MIKTSSRIIELRDGWKRKDFISDKDGIVLMNYLYRGNHKSQILKLETRKAKHLTGYTLISKDLRDAKVWLKEADKLYNKNIRLQVGNAPQEGIIAKGLLKASLANYQKAFGTSGGRLVRLHKKQLPLELHKAHDEFEEARHHYVAHGGTSKFESCKMICAIPPKDKLKGRVIDPYIESVLFQTAWMEPEKLISVIEAALQISDKKAEELRELVYYEINNMDMAKLYKFMGRKESSIINDQTLAQLQ